MPIPLVSALFSFVVSLLVGALAIYVAASVVVDVKDYGHAIVTALVGALAWLVATLLVGWIPLLGSILAPLLALIAYLWVISRRYPGGWGTAAIIALIAWAAAFVFVALLSVVGIDGAIGVPFV